MCHGRGMRKWCGMCGCNIWQPKSYWNLSPGTFSLDRFRLFLCCQNSPIELSVYLDKKNTIRLDIWPNQPREDSSFNVSLISVYRTKAVFSRNNSKSGVNEIYNAMVQWRVSIPYQAAATAQAHTMCSPRHAAKESLQLIVFRKQWPPIYNPSQQLWHYVLTTPSPWPGQVGSQAIGVIYKTIPLIRHGYTEATLCLPGEHQELYLIQTHLQIYMLRWQKQGDYSGDQ